MVSPATPSSSPRYRITTRRPIIHDLENIIYEITLKAYQNGVEQATKIIRASLTNEKPKIGNITMPLYQTGLETTWDGFVMDRVQYVYKNHYNGSDISTTAGVGAPSTGWFTVACTTKGPLDSRVFNVGPGLFSIMSSVADISPADDPIGYATFPGFSNSQVYADGRTNVYIGCISYSTNGSDIINVGSDGIVNDNIITEPSVDPDNSLVFGQNENYHTLKAAEDDSGNIGYGNLSNTRLSNLEYEVVDAMVQRPVQYWGIERTDDVTPSFAGGYRTGWSTLLGYRGEDTAAPIDVLGITLNDFGFRYIDNTLLVYVSLRNDTGGPWDWGLDGMLLTIDVVAKDTSVSPQLVSDPYRLKFHLISTKI